jgi:protein-export membrane protein SecD
LTIGIGLLFALPNFFSKNSLNSFPNFFPNQQVNLGLDLQGGSHLLLEVDTDVIINERIDNLTSDLRKLYREEDLKISSIKTADGSLKFKSSSTAQSVINKIKDLSFTDSQNLLQVGSSSNLIVNINSDEYLEILFTEEYKKLLTINAVNQSLEIIRRRIDELGTREPTIQRQGTSRIIIQVPGLEDPDQIKSLLGQTAKLTFQLVDQSVVYDPQKPDKAPIGSEVLPSDDDPHYKYIVKKRVMVSAIQRGDKILTSGGMKGKVVRVINDFDIEVEISQGVNVVIVKSTVSEVEATQPVK